MGISENDCNLNSLINKFNSNAKVQAKLKTTKDYWASQSKVLDVVSGNQNFDNWLRWVNIQPTLRKIFGCSFLPDFDGTNHESETCLGIQQAISEFTHDHSA
jgi:hypothetical protein